MLNFMKSASFNHCKSININMLKRMEISYIEKFQGFLLAEHKCDRYNVFNCLSVCELIY